MSAQAAVVNATVKSVQINPIQRNVNQTLNVSFFDDKFTMYGFDQALPGQPRIIEGYHFSRDDVETLFAWYNRKGSQDGYYIYGPAGCGKTSLPEQVFTRFNIPVYKLECHETTETHDFLGTISPSLSSTGEQAWVRIDGPLYKAVKYGGIFIADEFDRLPPGITSMLHDLLDGKSIFVPMTGESLVPHPLFKFIATGNSSGSGDETGLHTAVQHQDLAILDRFWCTKANYLPQEAEVAILEAMFSQIPEAIRNSMVDVANTVRGQHISNGGTLPLVFSTRTLTRWADMKIRKSSWSFKKCLEIALTNRASNQAHANAILEFGFAKFGNAWSQ
jgi:cobaltochelatase CobS